MKNNRLFQSYSLKTGRFVKPVTAIFIGCLLATFAACNSNKPKQEEKATLKTVQQGSYSMAQQLFCLNMLSDISAMYNFDTGSRILDSTNYAINTVLDDSATQTLMGTWKCVWGPSVLITNKNVKAADSPMAANTVYIAQSMVDTTIFVVAIAGTNAASTFDWIVEDADVVRYKYWNAFCTHPDTNCLNIPNFLKEPYISKATCVGVYNLITMNGPSAYGNTTLVSYLQQKVASQPNNKFTIWTTGHSLGGALSPTLALYLYDCWAKKISNNRVLINCMPVAGPTPGNLYFANYYAAAIPNTTRVWSQLDVVPHLSQSSMMQQIPILYDSAGIKLSKLESGVIVKLANLLSVYNYQQLFPSNTGFKPAFFQLSNAIGNPKLKDTTFVGQLLCQHVPEYPHYFGVDSFQARVKTVMHYTYPYFSAGYTPVPIIDSGVYPVIPASFYNK